MPPWPLKHQHDQGCNDHHPDQGVRWWSWWSRWVGHRCSRNMRAQAQSSSSYAKRLGAWGRSTRDWIVGRVPAVYSLVLKAPWRISTRWPRN